VGQSSGLLQALRLLGLLQAAEQVSSVVMSTISIRNHEVTPDADIWLI
jgi:hypothetical protein